MIRPPFLTYAIIGDSVRMVVSLLYNGGVNMAADCELPDFASKSVI